jgi:hypothetical protein
MFQPHKPEAKTKRRSQKGTKIPFENAFVLAFYYTMKGHG